MKTIILLLSLSSHLFAATEDFNSSVTSATGGGGRAAVEPYGAALLNPALLGKMNGRHFTSAFMKDQMVFSFVDSSKTNLFAGGLSYKENRSKDLIPGAEQNQIASSKDKPTLQRFTLSLADQITESFGMGLNVNMWSFREDTKVKKTTSYNFDIGVLWSPFQNLKDFNFAAIFSNIGNQGEEQTTEKTAFAFSYVYNNFARFRYDVESAEKFDFKKPAHMFGFESYLNDWIVTRVGYRIGNSKPAELAAATRETKESDVWSLGIGFAGPQLGVHYAYAQESQNEKEIRHSIDLGYSF